MAHTPPDHLTADHAQGHCESSVSAAIVTKRFERGDRRGHQALQPRRGVTVRYNSLPFVTALERSGSQEVDGSIPFSSTIYSPGCLDALRSQLVGRRLAPCSRTRGQSKPASTARASL